MPCHSVRGSDCGTCPFAVEYAWSCPFLFSRRTGCDVTYFTHTKKGVVTDSYDAADDSDTEDDNGAGDEDDEEEDGDRGSGAGADGGGAGGGGDASTRSTRAQSDNNFEGHYDQSVGDDRYSSDEDESKIPNSSSNNSSSRGGNSGGQQHRR